MRFGLSCPELSCVIPGKLNPEQVDTNVVYSADAPFPVDLKAALAVHVRSRNVYQWDGHDKATGTAAPRPDCRRIGA